MPCRILVVESLAYLPRLREMFPRAELLACADDPELALAGPAGESWARMGEIPEQGSMEDFFRGLGVEFTLLDYLSQRLPYGPESLDYIICDLALERAGKFQELEAVDGLFIATQYDIPWREDILTGWHMYDTAMCMEMRRAGYKVAVPNQEEDFWCIHCPKEKPLASSYRGYQKAFLKEYGKELHPEV